MLPLGFASPLILLGLLSLPVLWWLLRLTPPRPLRVDFPPARLLFDIVPKEETPSRTPWWLTLLRLLLAALVILAAAGPLWNPPAATTGGTGPLALLIDDGLAAAATWDARIRAADDLVVRAEADGRTVAIVPLSEGARDAAPQAPANARVRLAQMRPKPHLVERADSLPGLSRLFAEHPAMEAVWLSDGTDLGTAGFATALAQATSGRSLRIIDGGLSRHWRSPAPTIPPVASR